MSWETDLKYIPTSLLTNELVRRGASTFKASGSITLGLEQNEFTRIVTIRESVEEHYYESTSYPGNDDHE